MSHQELCFLLNHLLDLRLIGDSDGEADSEIVKDKTYIEEEEGKERWMTVFEQTFYFRLRFWSPKTCL